MNYFSVPADFKFDTIEKFDELNRIYEKSKIIEVYGQVTEGDVLNSGRVTSVLPEVSFKSLERYVRYITDYNIEFNYTINPSCMGNLEFSRKGSRKIRILLERLKNIGIRFLTVSSPPLIELVQASGLNFGLRASALCEITSPGKALFYKKAGMERIVIDPDITRDFRTLRNIYTVFGDGVELIANNVCYKNCAYKMFHYNHESHCTPANTSQSIRDYYFNRCAMQKAGSIENIIKLNWVRPEDLKYYNETGISYFKIQGRQNVLQGDIVRALRHYMDQIYEGNLYDLITIFAPYNAFQPFIDNRKLEGFIKKLYENPDFCRNVCQACQYCKTYAKKCISMEEAARLNKEALEFYREYDQYTKLIRNSANQPVKRLLTERELGGEFDI